MKTFEITYIPLHAHPDHFGAFRPAKHINSGLIEGETREQAINKFIDGTHVAYIIECEEV